MLCRSKERAESARTEIAKLSSNQEIQILLADLAELSQVEKVVQDLQAKEKKVDVLVCNAGVLLNDRQTTKEGNFELTFASHLMGGSFLLSQLLMPQLTASSDQGRVVFVSSGGMYNTPFPAWETATSSDLQKYDGQMAYAYAKRGQILLAEHCAKEYPEISWTTCHPGWTQTPAVDAAYGDQKRYLEPMRNTWQGCEGIAWMVGCDKTKLENGAFYLDRQTQRKHLSGPFFTEGIYTKNTPGQVEDMIQRLRRTTGLDPDLDDE